MPRAPATPSTADANAAPGGAAAVDRALSLLAAFRSGDGALTLAELAARTGLYKSTALRLLASLEHARFLQRREGPAWVPGPELARLAAVQAQSFSLQAVVQPALRALVAATGESAAFHVRQGEARLCLFREDSPQVLRDHTRAGDTLPLRRGSGGRVLLAFAGARGALYEQIRREGVVELVGDRVPDLVGISAPVFASGGTLAGALTLTLPATRRKPGLPAQVRLAAQRLSHQLGA